MRGTGLTSVQHREVWIPAGAATLEGVLGLPSGWTGIVLFAHGSDSSRFSPRNRFVAATLEHVGIGTLLFDLLTEFEIRSRTNVFDIELLARRLSYASQWLREELGQPDLPVGFFGASTGAPAALLASTWDPGARAIVSRGGRPDLADNALERVTAPTLFIVGGADTPVLELNNAALARLSCVKKLAVVPGATHLFEEPGALDEVAHLAARWFELHLTAGPKLGRRAP